MSLADGAAWEREYGADAINPPHYQAHPGLAKHNLQVIDITEHLNFNLGNVVKYVLRHEGKNGLEDLKKAEWYIKREIARLEGK